eukprot:3703282-Prymnesium_polylepis.1
MGEFFAPVHIGREDLERDGGPPTDSRIASNVLNSMSFNAGVALRPFLDRGIGCQWDHRRAYANERA